LGAGWSALDWREANRPLFAALALERRTVGLIIMLGAGVGAYNAPFGLALFIPLTSVSMLLVSLWVAAQQRDAELVRIKHERHLQLVAAELNHRVKNTLAIVQSFAHQSFRTASSPEQARANFEGRLTALAAAHSILTHRNWDSVNMPDLITNSLEVHNDAAGRFYLDGPDLVVSPKTSVTLAMTLHELATNSLKYGALSVPEGRVRIAWGIDDSGFRFEWADEDGPAAAQPERRGFGTQMLERALASELGGRASLEFAPEGFRYEVWAPGGVEL
jgi:two-component sensor histidine kinase